jgi:hypothetical protein
MKEKFNEDDLKNYLQRTNKELIIKRTEPDIEDCFMALMPPTPKGE